MVCWCRAVSYSLIDSVYIFKVGIDVEGTCVGTVTRSTFGGVDVLKGDNRM